MLAGQGGSGRSEHASTIFMRRGQLKVIHLAHLARCLTLSLRAA